MLTWRVCLRAASYESRACASWGGRGRWGGNSVTMTMPTTPNDPALSRDEQRSQVRVRQPKRDKRGEPYMGRRESDARRPAAGRPRHKRTTTRRLLTPRHRVTQKTLQDSETACLELHSAGPEHESPLLPDERARGRVEAGRHAAAQHLGARRGRFGAKEVLRLGSRARTRGLLGSDPVAAPPKKTSGRGAERRRAKGLAG